MNIPRDISYSDQLLQDLKDPAEAAAYIEAVMEQDDPATLLIALRQVAKAHGMAEVAKRANVGDKSLFKVLSPDGNPTLSTVHKVLHAVGLRLSVVPEHA
jgi:probable addiction module antidote protein